MREIIAEAGEIVDKKNITLKDYQRFRVITRQKKPEDTLYLASFESMLFHRLHEIAEKEGNYDWLEPEDED